MAAALLKNHVSWNMYSILYCYSIFSNENLWKNIFLCCDVNKFYNIYNKMFNLPVHPIISSTQVSSSWWDSQEYTAPAGLHLSAIWGAHIWLLYNKVLSKGHGSELHTILYCTLNTMHYSNCICFSNQEFHLKCQTKQKRAPHLRSCWILTN